MIPAYRPAVGRIYGRGSTEGVYVELHLPGGGHPTIAFTPEGKLILKEDRRKPRTNIPEIKKIISEADDEFAQRIVNMREQLRTEIKIHKKQVA